MGSWPGWKSPPSPFSLLPTKEECRQPEAGRGRWQLVTMPVCHPLGVFQGHLWGDTGYCGQCLDNTTMEDRFKQQQEPSEQWGPPLPHRSCPWQTSLIN